MVDRPPTPVSASGRVDFLKEAEGGSESLAELGRDRIEPLDHLRRELQLCRGEVLPQVPERRRAGNEENVRRALEEPRERDLHRRR